MDIFPEIKLPSILITTFYRGLSPSEMEGAISFRLEQRFVKPVMSSISNRSPSRA